MPLVPFISRPELLHIFRVYLAPILIPTGAQLNLLHVLFTSSMPITGQLSNRYFQIHCNSEYKLWIALNYSAELKPKISGTLRTHFWSHCRPRLKYLDDESMSPISLRLRNEPAKAYSEKCQLEAKLSTTILRNCALKKVLKCGLKEKF